jgi:hypothetical protein
MAIESPERISLMSESDFERRISRWRERRRPEVADGAVLDVADANSYVLPRFLPESGDPESNERPIEAVLALQSWEGVVLAVSQDSFLVRVVDAGGEHDDEEVTVSKDELSDFDLDLLEAGAILYWTIGYRRRIGGARERVSRMRLRRLPAWSSQQLEEAQQRAEDLERELDW